jgi:acyl CoA:acetate/3-ketoacid CoA transferase alpha subunit
MVENREERRRIKERDSELVAHFRSLEMELLVRLDEQGMLKASTDAGTASITETILPNVVDWDAVYEHIRETGDFYLLQKRPATAAFRELHQSDIKVPGMEPYTKRTISLRKT